MSNELFRLGGQVALVTGGNGGIGRAIALASAEAGANVAILGRNQEKNRAVLAELSRLDDKAIAVEVDLAERQQISRAFEEVEDKLGSVSILVNNAGILRRGSILTVYEGDWQDVLSVNLNAPFVLARLAAPAMKARMAGKIINVSSATIAFGNTGTSAYAVSKGALAQLTRCLAVELAPFNVQVNAIAPGLVDTDMIAASKGTPFYDYGVSRTPAGRWAKPEEIAGAALYLASSASSYVTGEVLFVDGGYTAKQ
jgi:NAD(P)-dependent dehydrogenase (short-subunit alcohol dehydrogenase family)